MYFISVLLLLLVLPVASGVVDHMHGSGPWLIVLGKWFVFWAAGARLMLAGLRQILRPEFTAKEIFGFDSRDVLPIVQELGIANLSAGVVGLLAVTLPTFVLPAAVAAAVFYAGAGIRHALQGGRSTKRAIAMWSDLLIAIVFSVYVFERIRLPMA